MSVLTLTNVSGGYGRSNVLRDVSIIVGKGEIVTIVGANGAGKSSLLRGVLGLLPHFSGEVTFLGEPVDGLPTEQIVRRGLSLVPERRQLFDSMTVEENLSLGGFGVSSGRVIRSRMAVQFARFPVLAERRRQLARTLSGGQQQMLALARGLMSEPTLLMLDEPSLGLAPLIVQQVLREIENIKSAGGTVLLIEQNAAAALRIADRAYVMKGGQMIDDRAPRVLLADKDFSQTYLGGLESDSLERRLRSKACSYCQSSPPGPSAA